jgi:holo-[acyl-carrier protein] synthase
MNLVGIGIDVVDLREIEELLEMHGEHALAQFTQAELAYAGTGPNRIERLAARHAAKEAVMKALGVGWDDGIAWTDIEVCTTPTGAPTIQLHGGALELASQAGVSSWLVSLSHSETVAVASVVALTHS